MAGTKGKREYIYSFISWLIKNRAQGLANNILLGMSALGSNQGCMLYNGTIYTDQQEFK